MRDRHHVIDIGVASQNFGLDALYGVVDSGRDALDCGCDSENVARSRRSVGIAIALEGVAFKRRKRRRGLGRKRKLIERWRFGQIQHFGPNP